MCSIGTFWEYFSVSLWSGSRANFPYGVARQTHWVSAQKCWLVPSRWAEKTTRASRLRRRWSPDGREISIFNKRRHRPHYHNSSFPSQMDSSPLCCGFTLHVHVIKSPLKVWRRCFVPPSGWWWRKGGSETEGGAVRQGLKGSGCSSNSVSWPFTSNLSRSVLSCSIKWLLISINTKMQWFFIHIYWAVTSNTGAVWHHCATLEKKMRCVSLSLCAFSSGEGGRGCHSSHTSAPPNIHIH